MVGYDSNLYGLVTLGDHDKLHFSMSNDGYAGQYDIKVTPYLTKYPMITGSTFPSEVEILYPSNSPNIAISGPGASLTLASNF